MIAITMACRLLKNPRRLITAEESVSPKVSVVIPVYNSAKYLHECVDSVLAQSFSDWEVVAVDDGSSDDSPAILDEYAAKDSRIHVIHKPNGGVSAARNDGLDAAIGEYVLFVDSDDYLEQDALRLAYEEAIRVNADVVVTGHWNWRENSVETEHYFFSKDFVTRSSEEIASMQRMVLYKGYSLYPSDCCSYMFSALWSKLIRRELLVRNAIRFSSTLTLYEDGLVALQVFEHARVVAYRHVPTYHYRILNNSLCHINEKRLIHDCDEIVSQVGAFVAQGREKKLGDAFLARVLFLTKKLALRSFFCKGSTGSFFKRYREFAAILKKNPYAEAVAAAPSLKLCGNEKSYGALVHAGFVFAVALMYEMRTRFLHR